VKPELRIGIVGCGNIARAHISGYGNCAGIKIAAVFDPVPDCARKMAGETGARAAGSVKELIDRDKIDAVSICSPPSAHLDNCAPFLEAGVHVLCEKPLEVNAVRAAKLAALAKRSNSLFMTAFCHRFHPPVIEARRLIREGVLGQPVLFRNIFGGWFALKGNHRMNRKLSGGGCLVDHACHSVDLFRFLAGEPTAVQAVAANVAQKVPIEDFGLMHLSVRDKVFGEITASYSLKVCENLVEWYGTKGTAVIGYGGDDLPDLRYKAEGAEKWTVVDCRRHPDRFTGEIRHFLECVRLGRRPSVTVEDGLQAARIAAAVYESAATGRRVTVRKRG